MAHIHDPAPRTIYGIVAQDNHLFYIGKTYPHRVGKTYSEHLHGRVRKTQEMFSNCNIPPAFYILEEAEMSTTEAFRHCVAWTKYFLNHGYAQAFPDVLSEYAADMIPETQRIYESIKNRLFDNVLAPDNALLRPREKTSSAEKSDCIQFSIRFTPQEHAKIVALAKQHNFCSTTAYCKHMAIAGRVIELDTDLIQTYTDYFRDDKTLLRQILLSIYKTGRYYPADMQNIQSCIDRLTESHGKVLDGMTSFLRSLRRDGYEDISDV